MWKPIYTILTTHEGVYIFYVVPIVYFATVICNVIFSRRTLHEGLRVKDVMVVIAIGLISLDFVNYLYLFLTKTGKLLPAFYLLIKYTVGFLLWLWIFWYSYKSHFTRRVAREHFKTRCLTLLLICAGSFILALVGIIIS